MNKVCLLILTVLITQQGFAFTPQGPSCNEDILLINDQGCDSPCCYEDPVNSGHYVFRHDSVEKIDIRGNASNVLSVSFPNLTYVEKSIRISYNQPGAITSISFPALRNAGSIEIVGNPGLTQVDFPLLQNIENSERDAFLKIQSNNQLASMNIPLLSHVTATDVGSAYVQIRYNPMLGNIELPNLKALVATEDYSEAYLFIQSNDLVGSIRMNQLTRLVAGVESISYLVIDEMPQLQELSFPRLTELLPTGSEYNFNELTVAHSPNLESFVFPSLERVSLLQLSGMKGTRKAMFPNLAELQYLWVFRSCQDLESTLKMYICSELPIMDVLFNNDDGQCGSAGYMLYSENVENMDACDDSAVCQSFTPDIGDCHCGNPGLCTP